MANREQRSNREKKKPKKAKPKFAPPRRDVHVIPTPAAPKPTENR